MTEIFPSGTVLEELSGCGRLRCALHDCRDRNQHLASTSQSLTLGWPLSSILPLLILWLMGKEAKGTHKASVGMTV